jgi:hypothetical protein
LNCDGNEDWYLDRTQHANANDETHSFQYLVDTVFGGDDRVSSYLLDSIRDIFIDENDHTTDGYRILLDVTYPCFITDGGHRVELQRGIHREPAGFTQNLKLINVPVLKDHWYTSLTGCLKHTYGILSMAPGVPPLDWHDGDVGQIWGTMMQFIKTPVLNIVDAIWVSQGVGDPPTRRWGLPGYPPEVTTRVNQLLAGQDPVALDYWAAKYILYPIDHYLNHHPDFSKLVHAWLTSARDTINDRGGLYDPDNAIYVRDVTMNEAQMAVHTRNMAGRLIPGVIHPLRE